MPSTIITKNSSTASSVPSAGSLTQGELAVNVADKRLFTKDSGGAVVEVGTNPSTLSVAGNVTLGDASTDTLNVGNGGLIKDASGNLGLGVTPSAWGSSYKALQLQSGGLSAWALGGINGYLYSNAYYDGSTNRYVNTGTATSYATNNGSGIHAWFNAPSGTAGNAITFTQAMTLDASGRLLVGTTSSSGSIATFKGSQQSFIIRNGVDSDYNEFGVWDGASDGLKAVIKAEGGLGKFGTRTNSSMVFQTNDTERARIDSSGRLMLGTTTTSITGADAKYFDAADGQRLFSGRGSTASREHIIFQNPNGTVGSITTSGSVTLYNTTSDQRLKQNIQDSESSSSLIDSLKVRQYNWKSDNSHQRYGFIAQELLTVAPEAVSQPEDTDQMMAVDYSKLVPMLVKEVQSLRKRLADAGI